MSTSTPSRNLPTPINHEMTLAVLREQMVADETLSPRQRQDIASALRTLAKALQMPLERIPAHPGYLRDRLKGFTPAMAGLTAPRWRNILSLVRFALKQAGLAHLPGRYREPLAPEWAELIQHLDTAQARFGLSRLFRYCGVHGIAPESLNDQIMDRFFQDLLTAGLVDEPRRVHRTACILWNKVAAAIATWPQQRLAVPDYSRTYALPWSVFPASLKAEVDAYLARLAGQDILAELPFRPLKPASLATRARQLQEYASALVHRGRDPAILQSLAEVVAVDVFKDGLRFFLDRAGGKPNVQTHNIATVVKALAQHWVKVTPGHLEQLRAICQRLDPGHRGLADKNRDRLRQFDDPDHVRALVTLPQRLLAEVVRSAKPSRATALQVQAAVAIELLLMVPLRINNLAHLKLGEHLIRSRKGIMHLAIPGHEVKNGVAIEALLQEPTVRLLDVYVESYLPLLRREPSPWLFPGRSDNTPKSRDMLRSQIIDCVKQRCGLLVNPHLFRHIAAKLYLEEHPGAYGVVRLLHGHKSVDTTTRFYCGMETAAAMQHYDDHILQLRGAPAPAAARRRRG